MDGCFDLKTPNDLFGKAEKDYNKFYDNPNDYDLFNLLTTLNHLRDWIYPDKYKAYKGKNLTQYTRDEKLHNRLHNNENYQKIRELCNRSKHFKSIDIKKRIVKKTETITGFIFDFNKFGDGFGQKNYIVDGQDIRDIIDEVFNIYKTYFSRQK